MIFTPTEIEGVLVLDIEPAADDRGFFARTWCAEELAGRGLSSTLDQCSLSFNEKRHTLRGMHWQAAPHAETKIVGCRAGSIHDVLLDLRPGSPTYRRSIAVELSASSRRSLYVPPGIAHGFLTLQDATEVTYLMTGRHEPGSARGVRWDDPRFALAWPAPPAMISERDRCWPDFAP